MLLADRRAGSRSPAPGRRPARDGRKSIVETSLRTAPRIAHEVDQRAGQLGVGERVVGGPAVERRDRRHVAGLALGAQADRQLVDLVQAALRRDLDERDREQRRDRVDVRGLDHAHGRALAAVRAEPRLPRDERAQLGLGETA